MKFVGIDLHKNYSHFAVLDQTGRVVTRARIPTQREALVKFFSELGGPARAALEAGRSWYWVYDLVSQLVTELKLVATHRMKVIAESTVKTDKIDARVIAELLRVDYLPTRYVPPGEVREQREILRQRTFVVQLRTKVKNRIHCLLDKLGVEHPFDDLFCGRGLSAGTGRVFKASGGFYRAGEEEQQGYPEAGSGVRGVSVADDHARYRFS